MLFLFINNGILIYLSLNSMLTSLIWFTENSAYSGRMFGVAVISTKNHKRQRRKRQSVTAKRENSQTPKVLTAILTLPNLT